MWCDFLHMYSSLDSRRSRLSGIAVKTESMLHVDQDLESAVDHALHIKGHLLHIDHLFHLFYHLSIEAISMRPRLENDIRKHHGLAGLQLHHSRKRHSPLGHQVIAYALLID